MGAQGGSAISRETRLLAATIAVSLVVLLVLSRFRFPDTASESRDGTSAQPLARLAARAAFDDLSLALRELGSRVDGSLITLRVAVPGSDAWRPVPALRVRDDVAMALLPEGWNVAAIAGATGPVTVLGRDTVREVTLVRVPTSTAPVLAIREGQQPLTAPGYVAIAEADAGGPALRPHFVGRSEALGDPRWDGLVVSLGRSAANSQGAPVFTLDGRLVGLITMADQEPAIVPASALLATVDPLLRGAMAPPGDIGVVVQSIDTPLAAATGTRAGAAVVTVRVDGPADGRLVPGDVVTAVNGVAISTHRALEQRVARSAPGTALSLTVRRDGALATITVPVASRPAAPQSSVRAAADTSSRPLGLTLRALEGRGSEIVRVQGDSAGAAGGLVQGDVVIAMGATRSPAPAVVTRAFEALPAGGALLLSVERDGQARLVAVPR